ncbi:hypothetical protein DFJ74DRAFT_712189 [Hyaloraphidium curvatum]|nr:hypothetical protein DFJ74DRAFT_712189 [Hyaloraphidium curvatum]
MGPAQLCGRRGVLAGLLVLLLALAIFMRPPWPPRHAGPVAVRTRGFEPVHGATWTLVAASLDAAPNGTAFLELALFIAASPTRRSDHKILVSDPLEGAPRFVLGPGGVVEAGTAVALPPQERDLARVLCPVTAAGVERLKALVGRTLKVQLEGALDAAFELEVVPFDPSAGAGRVTLCTQPFWNRSFLEQNRPDAVRLWFEHHFSNGAVDSAVLYDLDGSFAPTAAALGAAGREVRYFPRWRGMPSPAPRGLLEQTAALHHCTALARWSAEWAVNVDPDEFVVCRGALPLQRLLEADPVPDAVILDRAFFTHPGGPADGPGLAEHRFPDMCQRASKLFFRTWTAAAPDMHHLYAVRASLGREKLEVRAAAGELRVNHYMDAVRYRNKTRCVDPGKAMVRDGWMPGERCRVPPPRSAGEDPQKPP